MKRIMQAMILFNTCSRRSFLVCSRLATQLRQKSTLRKLYGVSNEEWLRSNTALLPLLRGNSFKVAATSILPFPVRGVTCSSWRQNEREDNLEGVPEEQSAKEKREKEIRRNKYALIALCASAVSGFIYATTVFGKPRTDEEGNEINDEFSHLPTVEQYVLRTIDNAKYFFEFLRDPSRELLLPPPLEYPYVHPPYTLCIELTGVLLNSEWTLKTGRRFKRRAFLDYFLQQCGPPLFELVIFTQEDGNGVYQVIDSMDPNGYIMHRLFRDSTRYEFRRAVRLKDLNCLNRDLKRVIHVDWDRNACQLNPDNCLILKKWEGDSNDKSLYDLAQFLRTIAAQGVDDVREIISHYSQQPDPLEAFRDYQRRMAELEESKAQTTKQPSTLVSSFKRK